VEHVAYKFYSTQTVTKTIKLNYCGEGWSCCKCVQVFNIITLHCSEQGGARRYRNCSIARTL